MQGQRMIESRRNFLLGSTALALLMTRPVASSAAPSGLTGVTALFSRPAPGADSSFLWAAKALGYFQAEGLDVTIQTTEGSPESARLIAAGQGDIAVNGAEATIISVAKGLPVKDVFCIQQRMIYSLGVPETSPLRNVAELKGKRIGVQSLTASPVFVAKALLREAGLNPDQDATFLPIGVGAQAVAAVKSGQVDAAAFHDTQFLLFQRAGAPFRFFPMSAFSQYFTAGLVVRADSITKRPEMIAGFARAIAKALAYSFANPEASIRAMNQIVAGTNKDPAGALAELQQRLTYEVLPAEAQGQWGWNTPERYGQFADFLLNAGVINRKIDGSSVFDRRFLLQANAFDAAEIEHAAKNDHG